MGEWSVRETGEIMRAEGEVKGERKGQVSGVWRMGRMCMIEEGEGLRDGVD